MPAAWKTHRWHFKAKVMHFFYLECVKNILVFSLSVFVISLCCHMRDSIWYSSQGTKTVIYCTHWTLGSSKYLHKHRMISMLTSKKTTLHKHKMVACDSMLGYLISSCFRFKLIHLCQTNSVLFNTFGLEK